MLVLRFLIVLILFKFSSSIKLQNVEIPSDFLKDNFIKEISSLTEDDSDFEDEDPGSKCRIHLLSLVNHLFNENVMKCELFKKLFKYFLIINLINGFPADYFFLRRLVTIIHCRNGCLLQCLSRVSLFLNGVNFIRPNATKTLMTVRICSYFIVKTPVSAFHVIG